MRRLRIPAAIVAAVVSISLVSCDGVKPGPGQLPDRQPGAAEHVIEPAGHNPRYLDGVGAFRVNCKVSHYNYSDPILWSGKPMASHLHVFAGNDKTSYKSTPESIATEGGSTCTGGTANRTAYWAPALIDTGGRDWSECTGTEPHPDCELVTAGGDPAQAVDCTLASNNWARFCVDQSNAFQLYYKTGYRGVPADQVQNWPAGLRMIAGTATSKLPQPTTISWWACKPDNAGQQAPAYNSIAATGCQPGQLLVQAVEFPQCWNGRDLDSPDHKSHMAYGTWGPIDGQNGAGCPASHPVPLPSITQWVHYRIPAGADISTWRLASDMYDGPGGYSGHADWMNGWDLDVFQRVVDNCYRPGLDCQMNLLGDGFSLGGV